MRASSRPLHWPAAYLALALLFGVLVAKYHHPVFGFTAFFQLDASQEAVMLPVLKERPVYIYRNTSGYDGMFYAQLATSPALRDPGLPAAMDNFTYRAHRILGSAVAWVAGLGNPFRALDAYAILNPLCWCGLGVLLLYVFPPRSLHDLVAWGGIMFSAGVLGSVRWALTDLPALLLVAAAIIAAQRERTGPAAGLLAVAGLARETSLLAGLALAGRSVPQNLRRLLIVTAPTALWWGYVRWMTGDASPDGLGNLGWPGAAYIGKWRETSASFAHETNRAVPWLMLACVVGITVQAAWTLLRPAWQNLWWRVAIGQTALMLCFGHAPWGGYPDAAARVLLPLHLAFNALVPRTRVGLAIVLLGNVGLVSGVDLLLTRHPDPHELAAARIGEAGFVARTEAGWFDIERHGSRAWCWSGGNATLHVMAWHVTAGEKVGLRFKLKAFAPGSVTITDNAGDVKWSGEIAPSGTLITIALKPEHEDGRRLFFATTASARRENDTPHARALAYGISELQFVTTR